MRQRPPGKRCGGFSFLETPVNLTDEKPTVFILAMLVVIALGELSKMALKQMSFTSFSSTDANVMMAVALGLLVAPLAVILAKKVG